MLESDIQNIIIGCVKRVVFSDVRFALDCKNYIDDNEGFFVSWCDQKNIWLLPDLVDPLSCVIFDKNLERNKSGHDHLPLATICEFFDRRYDWVKSFQNAWFEEKNKFASITGYLTGMQVKNSLKKEKGYWE